MYNITILKIFIFKIRSWSHKIYVIFKIMFLGHLGSFKFLFGVLYLFFWTLKLNDTFFTIILLGSKWLTFTINIESSQLAILPTLLSKWQLKNTLHIFQVDPKACNPKGSNRGGGGGGGGGGGPMGGEHRMNRVCEILFYEKYKSRQKKLKLLVKV